MFTRKFTTVFVGVFICLLGIVFSVHAAWGNGGAEAPYQGNYTYSRNGTTVTSNASSMKWTQTAINNMTWDGTSEYLDQTADCVSNPPVGDRLHVLSSSTNIPNSGIYGYNDCGVYQWFEETEVTINPYSLKTTTSYWNTVNWQCVYSTANGELNVSFEPTPWNHKWLDKEYYSCGPQMNNGESQIPSDRPVKKEPEILREVNHNTFSYQVIRTPNGHLRVYATVNFLNEQVFEAYRAENQQILNSLLSKESSSDAIFVVVTFASPLSQEEAKTLIQNAQMDTVSYGIFGHMNDEVVSTYVSPLSRTVEDFSQEKQYLENIGEVVYDGIMTITGFVDNEGLQILEEYQGVALLDLTANRIQQELSDLNSTIELTQFVVPNPAWLIYSGELSLTK